MILQINTVVIVVKREEHGRGTSEVGSKGTSEVGSKGRKSKEEDDDHGEILIYRINNLPEINGRMESETELGVGPRHCPC
ncbi:hypothetical protein ACOSQ3_004681 [Xanthoceras sorbifolium]